MRWKDFMANSLPRSWTKSRRRNSILKNNKHNERFENQENNNDLPPPVDNKFEFDQNDNHFRYENKCMCVKEIPIVVTPRSSIIPRRNRNLSTYNSLPKTNPFLQESSPELQKISSDDGDDLPRTRSRIKTNPWLPSPKIPTAVFHMKPSTSNNSLLSSPTGSRCSSMDRSLGSRSLSGSRSSSLYSRSRSLDSPKDFDLIDLVKFDDDCQSGSGKLSSGIGLASDGEGTSISSMESEGFVFYESLDDLRTSPEPKKRDRSSFNYEDQFENMVESFHEKMQDSCTSLDLLTKEQEREMLVPPPRRNGARILVPKETLDEVDDGIGHSDDENLHFYVNLDYQKPEADVILRKEVRKKPKVKPKPRLSLTSTSSDDSEMVEINLQAQSLNLIENRASSSPKYGTNRPIEEIRANLEAKVHQLRLDKCLVEEKIRAAQEEERVREKLRYHQQVTLQRKQILARTLTDLRTKLEGQCQRLNQYPVQEQ